MKHIPFLISLVFLLLANSSYSQYYDTGQDPARVKWMQIKTDRFRIIYPRSNPTQGIEIARALEKSQSGITTLFPALKFKIPVLVHSYSVESNGYVAWAPKRMELFPMPEQNSIPGDPNIQLTVHELAHVYQMESLKRGFTRAAGYIIGEQAAGAVSSLLPMWLFEGDAVFAETALTACGRGRNAAFQKQMKALILDKGGYKYDKNLNGSFRDYVPDHYQSGYQMVAWGIAGHGADIWNKAIEFTGQEPFTINPVNISLNKSARLTKKKLYNETVASLSEIWRVSDEGGHENYSAINPDKKKQFINYYSPLFLGNDSILAIKTSLSSTPRFVIINSRTGDEKAIHTPGYMYPYLISQGAGKITWVETRPGSRWENRSFSVVMIHDLKTGMTRKLSGRTRYPAASISSDGKTICAFENTAENMNLLVFLDPVTGDVLKTAPSPGNAYLQRPRWSADNKTITVILLTSAGEGILSYDVNEGLWKTRKPVSNEDIQAAFLRNDSLFYSSQAGGTENIFVSTGEEVKQITRSRFGAIDPVLDGNRLIFSDYTSGGNIIAASSISSAFPVQKTDEKQEFLINKTKKEADVTEASISDEYNPVPYRKWQHLFRFHSWMPFYADIDKIQSDPLSVRPGFTIMSQNTLSTLNTTLGYEYTEDHRNVFHTKISWKGWIPVFESWLDYGKKPLVYGNPSTIPTGITLHNSVSIPLHFSTGYFNQVIRPSITSHYSRDIYKIKEGVYDYNQNKLAARLYLSNYSWFALRDIYPRWGQSVDLNYNFSPFDKDILGSAAFIRTTFFFPGIFRNNGIRIRYEMEKQNQSRYIFGNSISFPRGLNTYVLSKEKSFASVDYVFPVVYPDFNISSLFYLKRIRSGLFYDYASGKGNRYFSPNRYHDYRESFRSFGMELLGDFHLFRIPFMISGGTRASWEMLSKAPVMELLFNINIYGFNLGRRNGY